MGTKKKLKSNNKKEHFTEEAMKEFESGVIDRTEFFKKVSRKFLS